VNALSTIAEAVKEALTGAPGLGAVYTVQRCYVPPDYETAASEDLKLLVVAFEEDLDIHGPNATRVANDHVYGVKIAILKRVAAGDVTSEDALAELDALSDFRQNVIDFLKTNRVMGDAQLDSLTNAPAVYDPPALDQKKTFVSVIAAKYRMLR
jgi:hypothetical protein